MTASTMSARQVGVNNDLTQSHTELDDEDVQMSVAKRRKLDNDSSTPVLSENEVDPREAAAAAATTATSEADLKKETIEIQSKEDSAKTVAEGPATSILYVPGAVLPKLSKYLDQIVEIRIASKYLSTRNKEVSTRQIWGTDIYTDDSDIVAICQHSGKIMLRPISNQRYAGISAFFRVLPGQSHYKGSLRFKIQTRNWIPQYHKCSLKVISISPISQAEKLDPRSPGNQLKVPKSIATSGPTRRPYTKRRFSPEITIMFNLFNEPCLKYCLALIADRGMDSSLWTSTRLRKEALYLDTEDSQYELCFSGNNGQFDAYRFSRCSSANPNPPGKIPLPSSHTQVLEENVDWEEIEWGVSTVKVRTSVYAITKIKFIPITN